MRGLIILSVTVLLCGLLEAAQLQGNLPGDPATLCIENLTIPVAGATLVYATESTRQGDMKVAILTCPDAAHTITKKFCREVTSQYLWQRNFECPLARVIVGSD